MRAAPTASKYGVGSNRSQLALGDVEAAAKDRPVGVDLAVAEVADEQSDSMPSS
jgi:hypothetical protein